MEYKSRRERREAERAGLTAASVTEETAPEVVTTEEPSSEPKLPVEETKFPSRRELRQRGKFQSPPQKEEHSSEQRAASEEEDLAAKKTEEVVTESNEVPLVTEDQGSTQDAEIAEQAADEDSNPLTGRSFIYQDSSNTFSIDSIPDSLETTNGDLVVTNSESIEVVTGSHNAFSSVMDDLKFDSEDQKDTVAGRISLVDPVSARLVAESREPEIVIPGKIVVRNRVVTITFAVLGGVMFILAGVGLWWALSEMGPFSS